jgi:hypothetical protein
MNAERIEINGVWYVREDSVNTKSNFDFDEWPEADCKDSFSTSIDIFYEDDDYLLEYSIIAAEEAGEVSGRMPDIKVTIKETAQSEFWDNATFLRGLAELNEESIKSAQEYDKFKVTDELLNIIINLLRYAKRNGHV